MFVRGVLVIPPEWSMVAPYCSFRYDKQGEKQHMLLAVGVRRQSYIEQRLS